MINTKVFAVTVALAGACMVATGSGAAELAGDAVPGAFPAPPEGTYHYTIRHGTAGRIGTLTNTIVRNGEETIVETEIDISARILFVRVAREEALRRQVWRNGRIVSYESITRSGNDDAITHGWAEEDRFVVEGPKGRFVAPAGVFTTNPWTMEIINAEALMGEKNGTLYDVMGVEKSTDVIEFNGEKIETRYFQISGHRDEELWYDDRGVPVRFALRHSSGRVTFTLEP